MRISIGLVLYECRFRSNRSRTGLLNEMRATISSPDAVIAPLIHSRVNYRQLCLGLIDYPPHGTRGHAIDTGLVVASVKQMVGERIRSCAMHWPEDEMLQTTVTRA